MVKKKFLRRLKLSLPFEELIPEQMDLNGIDVLDIRTEHVAHVVNLPFHHRDPFDRLLIAQAKIEEIPLVSADVAFDAYTITRMW